ncbi:M48 family metallopeptidase [Patulibacter sp.]|uniref:M48 family metallopeptidase n=1 Tax=Patulibacter sp. TaxID=1912859 RepID=UPI002720656A|nr:M48 family metallopeptidase [Patulibacter sp.]MDO9407596.1 M48 family metallopeptidase [Patulibacter sp.]
MSGDDDLPVPGYRLKELDPQILRHPADRAATAALGSIPGIDTIVRRLSEMGYERALRQNLLASAVRLSQQQLPDVYDLHRSAYTTLDLARTPELYLAAFPTSNAVTIGSSDPLVLVHSQLIDQLDAPQQRVVFAHEAAHVLCDHVLYGTVLQIILSMGGSVLNKSLPTALPLMAVKNALLEWSRAAELTSDRVAALVVQDPLLVCRTLLSISAGTAADRLDLGAFLAQADDYGKQSRGLGLRTKLNLELGSTHPLSVRRAHELMAWVKSGDYDRIRDGVYPRRGEEDPDVRAEARAAADHYRERFQGAFKDVAGQAEGAAKTVTDWLNKNLGDR